MGLLNKKERILDVILTAKGKEQLAKNQLNFQYYAFSDEGVDYSGSMVFANVQSSSLDDFLHRNLAFEATQRVSDFEGNKFGKQNLTLRNILYTIPIGSKVLPEFQTSHDGVSEPIVLERKYRFDDIITITKEATSTTKTINAIVRVSLTKQTFNNRLQNYVEKQHWEKAKRKLENDQSIAGLQIGKNLLSIGNNRILNTLTFESFPESKYFAEEKVEVPVIINEYSRKVEVSEGVDSEKITFTLKTSEGEVKSTAGFFVEIFESGSDGKIKKLIRSAVEDSLNDDIVIEGYNSFFSMSIDEKEREED